MQHDAHLIDWICASAAPAATDQPEDAYKPSYTPARISLQPSAPARLCCDSGLRQPLRLGQIHYAGRVLCGQSPQAAMGRPARKYSRKEQQLELAL